VQPAALIAADAASFAVAGVLILSLDVGPATTGFSPARSRSRASRIVAADPMLRSLGASFFCSGAAITALQAVLVVAAAQRFGHDATVGWLYAAVGAGGVVGSVALLRWKPAPIGAGGISIGFLLEVAPFAVFALAGGLAPALGLLAFSTCAAAVYQTRGQTVLQETVPTDLLGRVNGVMRLLLYAGMLSGAIAAVVLVDVVGWSALVVGTTALAAGAYFVAIVALQIAQRRSCGSQIRPRRPRGLPSRSADRPSCPTRSTTRRSCSRAGSQAGRSARTRCATSAHRCGST
jgi:predicted MFS family arabinose efflux permease